ncbi:DUF4014 family protein [Salmonella enterica]
MGMTIGMYTAQMMVNISRLTMLLKPSAPLASRLRGSEMTKIFRKNYPRQSRFKEALFFLLFLILMVPISPIFFIWLAGVQAEKIAEWYSSIVWGPFNKLHNKLNPHREG